MKQNILITIVVAGLVGLISAGAFGFLGYTIGVSIGDSEGYQAGYLIGYQEVVDRNTSTGYSTGYDRGYIIGVAEGRKDSRNETLTTDVQQRIESSRNEGYREGYSIGFDNGLSKGTTDSLENGKVLGILAAMTASRVAHRQTLQSKGYSCTANNLCELQVSNDTSAGQRQWNTFNLNDMTLTFNLFYVSNNLEMKQRVIVDYANGSLSGEWRSRNSDWSEPFVVYNFNSRSVVKNSTNDTPQSQSDFLFSWYNESARQLGIDMGIEQLLSINRSASS